MEFGELHEKLIKSIITKRNPYEELSEFVNLSEIYNGNQSSPDIILEYIQQSGRCQEILELVKNLPEMNAKDVRNLLDCLYHILMRIATDLTLYSTVGVAIVNEILAHGMKTVLNFVQAKQKPSHIKLALHLLTAMVMSGSQIAHNVFGKLNISSQHFTYLYERSNPMEEEDVRACFLQLIMAFLIVGDSSLVRQLVELKGFLNGMFPGLLYDRAPMIHHVLSTLQSTVVENVSISKTSKIRLFNDFSLMYVLKLFLWSGPRRIKTSLKRKLGDDEEMPSIETDQKYIDLVKNAAVKFIRVLCCSLKHGIIFRDTSVGTSGRNFNHVITNLLKSFPSPYSNSYMSELVISILKVCPDQIGFYLPSLKDNLEPRFSTPWFQAINFLKQIVCSQDPVQHLFLNEIKKSSSKLVMVAKAICIPEVISGFQMMQAIKDQNPSVAYYLLDYFSCILRQVLKIADFCKLPRSGCAYSAFELNAFYQSFIASFMKAFPLSIHLKDHWTLVTKNGLNYDEEIERSPDIVDTPILSTYLNKILEIILIWGDIYPDAILDINFPELFIGIEQNSGNFCSEEQVSLQLKIVELIANQGQVDNLFSNKDAGESPLGIILNVYLSAKERKVNENVSQLIYKLLKQTNFFYDCEWEMNLWLTALKQVKSSHQMYVLKFFEKTLHVLFNDPNKFLDQILECQAIYSCKTQGGHKVSSDMLNNSVDQFQEPDEMQGFLHRQSFSPLVPASLFSLTSLPGREAKACKKYLEIVLTNIMHHQYAIEMFFQLAKKHENVFNPVLFDYWTLLYCLKTKKKIHNLESFSKKDTSHNLTYSQKLQNTFISSFLPNGSSNEDFIIDEIKSLSEQISNLNSMEILAVSWQLLIYIDIEISIMTEFQKRSVVLPYINLLDSLISSAIVESDSSFLQSCVSVGPISAVCHFQSGILFSIRDILSHPVIIAWFLKTDILPESTNCIVLKECSNSVTRFAIRIISQVSKNLHYSDVQKHMLLSFKDKVIHFCTSHVVPFVSNHKQVFLNSLTVHEIIYSFLNLLSPNDIVTLLECFLFLPIESYQKLDHQFLILSMLLEAYLMQEEYVLLRPNSVIAIFKAYFVVKEDKQKKQLHEYLFRLLQKHSLYAHSVPEEICCSLLKQQYLEDLDIIGIMLANNEKHRKIIRQVISSNAESLYHLNPVFLLTLINKCVIASDLFDSKCDNFFLKEEVVMFSKAVWKVLKPDFVEKFANDFCIGIGNSVKVFVEKKYIDLKYIEKKVKKIEKRSNVLSLGLEKISLVLQIIKNLEKIITITSAVFLKFVMTCLIEILSSSKNIKDDKFLQIITSCVDILKTKNISAVAVKEQIGCESLWTDFIQKNLKIALKFTDLGPDLLEVVTNFCKIAQDNNNSDLISVKYIHDLLTGHSNFFQIFLDENKLYSNVRSSILDLLILLVQINKEVCQDSHITLFLSSYNATLCTTDQKLLYLLKFYEECGINMSKFSPLFWGKAAIVHYSVKNNDKLFLWKQPKLEDILQIFHADKLIATAMNFPLSLQLEPSYPVSKKDDVGFSDYDQDQLYDPRFILPLLSTLLSPGSFVHCHNFIESKALVVIFASLSSYYSDMRAIGYYCLSEFYSHLANSTFRDRAVWISLLDTIKNSIESPNARLPSIITIFLVKTINVLTKPANSMYAPLHKFLTIKPTLDLGHVPEFYKLFGSVDIEHRIQRSWIISLIGEGLKSSVDFHLCQKRYIFTILLPYFTSSVCVLQEKVKILQILSAAVSVYSSARILCQSGILPWLHNAIKSCSSDDESIVRGIVKVTRILWLTSLKAYEESRSSCNIPSAVTDTNEKNESCFPVNGHQMENCIIPDDKKNLNSQEVCKWMYLSFPSEMLLVHLILLRKLNLLDIKALFHYLETLRSIVEHIQCSSLSNSLLDSKTVKESSLSFSFILDLYDKWISLDEPTCANSKKPYGVDSLSSDISTIKADAGDQLLQTKEFYTGKCHELFSRVILLWKPSFKMIDEEFKYAFIGTNFLCIMYQLLKVSRWHRSLSAELSNWLLFCLLKDEKYVLVKLLLSTEDKARSCLQWILEHFELSIKHEVSFCAAPKEFSQLLFLNKWNEIIQLLLKGVSNGFATSNSKQQLEILHCLFNV